MDKGQRRTGKDMAVAGPKKTKDGTLPYVPYTLLFATHRFIYL